MKLYSLAESKLARSVELERDGNIRGACNHLEDAINMMLTALKHEKNTRMKSMLSQKIVLSLDKMEKLKNIGQPRETTNSPEEKQFESANIPSGIQWNDVIGMESAKESIREAIILPKKFPKLFGNMKPWKAILLFGPGGTGKTMLASAVANETGSSFFSVSASDLISKWQGESEKLIRSLFESARNSSPSIIFFDEIDSISSRRTDEDSDSTRRIKTELLVQMQGLADNNKDVFVIGATNTPWVLDAAIRRRFEKRIYVGLPTKLERKMMFEKLLGKTEFTEDLVTKTKLFSGSDISILCRDIQMQPLRRAKLSKQWMNNNGIWTPCNEYPHCDECSEDTEVCQVCGAIAIDMMTLHNGSEICLPEICEEDIEEALDVTKPSINPQELHRYQEWCDQYGQG